MLYLLPSAILRPWPTPSSRRPSTRCSAFVPSRRCLRGTSTVRPKPSQRPIVATGSRSCVGSRLSSRLLRYVWRGDWSCGVERGVAPSPHRSLEPRVVMPSCCVAREARTGRARASSGIGGIHPSERRSGDTAHPGLGSLLFDLPGRLAAFRRVSSPVGEGGSRDAGQAEPDTHGCPEGGRRTSNTGETA